MVSNGLFLTSMAKSLRHKPFQIVGASGIERLSALYQWKVTFLASERDDLLDDVTENGFLNDPVNIAQTDGVEMRVWGIVQELTAEPIGHTLRRSVFRAHVVPRLWRATLNSRCRTFQNTTAAQIARLVFNELGFEDGLDYEFRLTRAYPEREYIVQYEETDFAFMSRLLENDGLFYFFEQGEDREKIIIADSNGAGRGQGLVGAVSATARKDFGILNVSVERRAVPRSLTLLDYNWRDPALDLVSTAIVSEEGRGFRFVAEEHYRTPDNGRQLVAIRAAELRVPERVYSGEMLGVFLHAGQRFEIQDWADAGFNKRYLATEVRYDIPTSSSQITVRFQAIPTEVPFRPPRVTPKPRIDGVLYGIIDGEFDSTAAPVDGRGCYRVRMMFDQSEHPRGQGSRWIRMAQPHGGAGYGLHFPLRRGTEVLIAHVGGDPDRPIIMAAIPNARTPSPVNSKNPTQSLIESDSGVIVEFEDDA